MKKKTASKAKPRKRDYKQEAKYHATPKQKKRRAERNKARATAVKAGKAKKGDGKDVHHPTNNTASKKTKVISASKNRSMAPCNKACRAKKAAGGRKSKPNSRKKK